MDKALAFSRMVMNLKVNCAMVSFTAKVHSDGQMELSTKVNSMRMRLQERVHTNGLMAAHTKVKFLMVCVMARASTWTPKKVLNMKVLGLTVWETVKVNYATITVLSTRVTGLKVWNGAKVRWPTLLETTMKATGRIINVTVMAPCTGSPATKNTQEVGLTIFKVVLVLTSGLTPAAQTSY